MINCCRHLILNTNSPWLKSKEKTLFRQIIVPYIEKQQNPYNLPITFYMHWQAHLHKWKVKNKQYVQHQWMNSILNLSICFCYFRSNSTSCQKKAPGFKLNFAEPYKSNWQVICRDQWSFVLNKWVRVDGMKLEAVAEIKASIVHPF